MTLLTRQGNTNPVPENSRPIPVGVPVVSGKKKRKAVKKAQILRQPIKVLKEMQQVIETRLGNTDNLIREHTEALKDTAEGSPNEEGGHASKEEITMLLEHQHAYRHDLEQALESIHNGTYGVCKKTGVLIPFERLLACPTAKTCVV